MFERYENVFSIDRYPRIWQTPCLALECLKPFEVLAKCIALNVVSAKINIAKCTVDTRDILQARDQKEYIQILTQQYQSNFNQALNYQRQMLGFTYSTAADLSAVAGHEEKYVTTKWTPFFSGLNVWHRSIPDNVIEFSRSGKHVKNSHPVT